MSERECVRAKTLSVPPGCRCVFGVEWAEGFDADLCAAHGPAFAALAAQVATLEGERDELLTVLDALADEFECQVREDGDELGKDDLAAARALVRRVRGGT